MRGQHTIPSGSFDAGEWAAYVVIDGMALARESALEEGPQEGVERVHSSDIGLCAEVLSRELPGSNCLFICSMIRPRAPGRV